jgi:hypothetical protein
MDPRTRRDKLEARIDSLENWLIASGAVVVIGLYIEWSKPAFSIFSIHNFAGLLITIGVAGELGVDYLAHRFNAHLRVANADIEAQLNRTIAELGPRAHRLAGKARADVASALQPFGEQKFQIAINLNLIADNELMQFMVAIWPTLEWNARWRFLGFRQETPGGQGVSVAISEQAPQRVREAATALCSALNALLIQCLENCPRIIDQTDPEIIVVVVMPHP